MRFPVAVFDKAGRLSPFVMQAQKRFEDADDAVRRIVFYGRCSRVIGFGIA